MDDTGSPVISTDPPELKEEMEQEGFHAEIVATQPTLFPHITLDLETLGVIPGSIVLSIGAVLFDPFTGDFMHEFYRNIDPATCEAVGLTKDDSTVAFWDDPAQAEAKLLLDEHRFPLIEALQEFKGWLFHHTKGTGDCCLWSRGYFDEVLLGAAYRAAGMPGPWHYRSPRDARTLIQTLQETGTADRLMMVEMGGVLHHALDDARNEARLISAAYQDLASLSGATAVPLRGPETSSKDEDDGA